MPKINILPRNIADLISAGEVVERPASAIKEIIENSIDAGSSKITVEIQNGGIRYIRVTDDGCGISAEDVPKAFISHATSKISVASDLNSIFTLGFRGEALASIAAVAKVEMITKTANDDFGTRYVIEGGEERLIDDAGCPNGTTIVVRELFYNTPARMKFLKRDMTEGNYVSDVVAKTAIIHPEISFRFIKDGKQTIFTPGDGNALTAITAVMGKAFSDSLIKCDYALNGVSVNGFVSLPRACKATRNSQYFFINSRYVKIPLGCTALDEAYKNSIMVGKFPYCVLNIKIPPETVDVNVHPAKTEVRFSDDKRIFEAIYYAVKNSIAEKDVRPGYSFEKEPSFVAFKGTQTEMVLRQEENQQTKSVPQSDCKADSQYTKTSDLPANETFSEEWKKINNEQLSNVKVYTYNSNDFIKACSPGSNADKEYNEINNISDSSLKKDDVNESCFYSDNTVVPPVSEDDRHIIEQGNESADEPKIPVPEFKYFGEAFKTYLFAETDDKIIIVDKHALHERIIYNEIKSRGMCTASQNLLLPLTVHLDRKEYAVVAENLNLLTSIGFNIEDFGEGSLLIRACPMMFVDDELDSVLSELAQSIYQHRKELLTEKIDWLCHSASCRAAVKGGSTVVDADAKTLIEKVLSDDSLRYCPHGRPVLIELSRRDIEKQFGRIQ